MIRTLPCRLYDHHSQTAVIGAGVIGLSVARALAKDCRHEVLILEQSTSIGSGISSRNSEVIHAGIYYDRDTMPFKSQLCVDGKHMMYDYCRERDIPYRQCGKLLVATDAVQRDIGLPQLIEYAKMNGVHDLQLLTKEQVAEYEPCVTCTGGVLSPSTGIVNSHAFMTSLLAEAEEYGATLALQCKVQGGQVLTTESSEEKGNLVLQVDESEIACDNVIICAGLATDKIAADILHTSSSKAQDDECTSHEEAFPKQYYAKGNYYKLENQKSPFSRLVYPLPDPNGGLGVHATIDLANSTRFGPDVEWLDVTTDYPDAIDVNVDPARADSFYAAIRKYWPELQDGNLVPDYSGVRPKLHHPNTCHSGGIKDFMIVGRECHGVKGLTLLLGIESPGLTSSLAIGRYVAERIKCY
jgi:L-2-hydroxyglutarate oxidase LhgO